MFGSTWIIVSLTALSLAAGSPQTHAKAKAKAATKVTTKDLVYVGTYTNRGNSKGVYAYRFDAASGQLSAIGLVAESDNPAFLAIDPGRKFLYASNETDRIKATGEAAGSVSAFSIDYATGKLIALNQVSSRDPGPAYVAVDHSGKDVMVANYALGSVTVFPILQGGRLGDASDFVRHKGSSVNPQRQQGPHGHAVAFSPDNRFALVADLGIDEVLVYPFDAAHGKLGDAHIVKDHPGAGPRHLTFSPDGKFVYLVNEMGSSVTVFSYEASGGNLTELQTISMLPEGFSGQNTAAEIQVLPSGKFLYASNRGDDSIAVFAINHAKGTLTFVQRVSTAGKSPRNFAIDPSGSWLLAANQNSNNIVTFRINPKTGSLTPTGQVLELSAPVCIQFVPLP